ncbi:hypothetical protein ATY35_17875 [Vibrio cidicii]|uniref:Uncharacterized protein n=1 Tax=Vibrio cidicii TaxID=1763883 RepID=A0ABR5VZC7_9VIBR|nr:hypothetical protein ATY35_17875 [Vibrio cidicii]
MTNTSESVQGALLWKQRKWLIRCGQKGTGAGKELTDYPFAIIMLPALKQASNLTLRDIRNMVSLYPSFRT